MSSRASQHRSDPHHERHEQHRRPEPERDLPRVRPRPRVLGEVGLEQYVTRGRDARLRDHHVARAGRQEVRDVEPPGSAQDRRDALLEQQALKELAVGLRAGARDAHELALGELRLDLPGAHRAVVGLDDLDPRVDERHPARPAEALVDRVGLGAAWADERLAHPISSSASWTWPSAIHQPRTSGSSPATPTMSHSIPGQSFAKFTSVWDGAGAERVWEWYIATSRPASSSAVRASYCSFASIWNLSGLWAEFSTRRSARAAPAAWPTMPQHSFGASSRAWATSSSKSARGIRTRRSGAAGSRPPRRARPRAGRRRTRTRGTRAGRGRPSARPRAASSGRARSARSRGRG